MFPYKNLFFLYEKTVVYYKVMELDLISKNVFFLIYSISQIEFQG